MPFRRTLPFAVMLPLAGCHSHLDARSNKLDSYPGDPSRVLVVVGDRLLPGASDAGFRSAISERLAKCGSVAEIMTPPARGGLARGGTAGEARPMAAVLDARPASFRPNAVMVFQARAARIVETRVNGIPSGRRVAGMEYGLDLLDAESERAVYRAAVSFVFPAFPVVDQGAELARLLVDRLAQDGVFTRCPPPTALPSSGPGGGR